MAEAEIASSELEDIDKPAKGEADLAKKWIAEIQAAEKAQAKWVERAKKIEKIYADERDTTADRKRKFNILWSNVETLRPAVYMRTPKAKAVRRYKDKDPEARFASLLIERATQTSCELYDFDHCMDQAVRDRLVPGRGQVWVFYQPNIVGDGQQQALDYEDVEADYIPWPDFLHSVCRTWSENWWVGRWFHKSRAELRTWLKERGLDPRKASQVAMDMSPDGDKTPEGLKDERARARILEVWNKRDKQVLYVAPGSGVRAILGKLPPPVNYRGFFPCPRPMLATTTAKSLMPTPDYAEYQDQAEELNRLNDRIYALTKALKVVGYYDSSSPELATILTAADGKMIPVPNWAMFKEGGGGEGKIGWFPVEVVAKVLEGLHASFEKVLQRCYEISGISDILRGATDPDETATAQGIKSKWGSLRVRRMQKDSQRFARDTIQLKAETICEKFEFKQIMAMAGVDDELLSKYVPQAQLPQLPPEIQQQLQQNPQAQQLVQQLQQKAQAEATKQFLANVEKLLRNDMARNFRIAIEADSTLEPDLQEEKQTAVEFTTAVGAFLKEALPIMMTAPPEVAKMLGEILLFVVRRFGDNVDQLEKAVEQAVEAASKPKPPQPDPEMVKVEGQLKARQAELQMKGQAQQQELAQEREMHQLEMGARVQEVQLEAGVKQMEVQQRAQEGQQKLELQERQGEQQLRQDAQAGALKQRQGEQQMSLAKRKAQFERSQREGGPPDG